MVGAVLLAALLFAQSSFADNPLLRGPRKSLRPGTAATEPVDGREGLLMKIVAAPVLFYQHFLGPHLGRPCAYHPSCSSYSLLAIRKHGAIVGAVMTFDRLQHEADEARYSPPVLTDGKIKVYDPPENNDFWWHESEKSAMEEKRRHGR